MLEHGVEKGAEFGDGFGEEGAEGGDTLVPDQGDGNLEVWEAGEIEAVKAGGGHVGFGEGGYEGGKVAGIEGGGDLGGPGEDDFEVEFQSGGQGFGGEPLLHVGQGGEGKVFEDVAGGMGRCPVIGAEVEGVSDAAEGNGLKVTEAGFGEGGTVDEADVESGGVDGVEGGGGVLIVEADLESGELFADGGE